MYKRSAYIFLLTWLVIASANALGGNIFHGSKSSSPFNISANNAGTSVSSDEPAYHEDCPESRDNKARSTRSRMRFLITRSVDANALLPYYQSVPGYLPVHVKQLYQKYVVRGASLPAYYGFLFRLSPF